MKVDELCRKKTGPYGHICTKPKGHKGRCSSKFISKLLNCNFGFIHRKIATDAYITPGDQKSVKNRADRCYPIRLTQDQVLELNRQGKKGVGIRAKFSSTPEDCFRIHKELTAQALAIPEVLDTVLRESTELEKGLVEILHPLISFYRDNHNNSLSCRICGEPITAKDFETTHGSSDSNSVQLGHIVPPAGKNETAHRAGNVQWIHRDCNIIQGDKNERETLEKLEKIVLYLRHNLSKERE